MEKMHDDVGNSTDRGTPGHGMNRRQVIMAAMAGPIALASCGGFEEAAADAPNESPSSSSPPPASPPAQAPASTPSPAPSPAPAPHPAPVPSPTASPPPTAQPGQGGLPSWVPGAIGEAALVPMANTLRDVAIINEAILRNESTFVYAAYSGGVYNPYYGQWGAHVIHGGGHSATQDNSVFIADFNTLRFERVGAPTMLPGFQDYEDRIKLGGFADDPTANPREVDTGVPGSAHTYDCLLILPPSISGDPRGALIRPVASAVGYGVSRETGWSHSFSFTAQKWSRLSTNACSRWTPGGSCAYDTERQRIWPLRSDGSNALSYLDLGSRTWSNAPGSPQAVTGYPDMVYSAYCAHRDIVVMTTHTENDAAARFYWFNAGSNGQARTPVSFSSGGLPPANWGKGSLLYIADLGKLIWFTQAGGDYYYEIDVPSNPGSAWSWIARPITGVARPSALDPAPYASTYKRMDYSPQLKSLLWVTARSTNKSYEFGGRVVVIRVAP